MILTNRISFTFLSKHIPETVCSHKKVPRQLNPCCQIFNFFSLKLKCLRTTASALFNDFLFQCTSLPADEFNSLLVNCKVMKSQTCAMLQFFRMNGENIALDGVFLCLCASLSVMSTPADIFHYDHTCILKFEKQTLKLYFQRIIFS